MFTVVKFRVGFRVETLQRGLGEVGFRVSLDREGTTGSRKTRRERIPYIVDIGVVQLYTSHPWVEP